MVWSKETRFFTERRIFMSTISRRIGNNIRIYRRANRMTLDELAYRIHKSKATVGKYEQGAISIDVDTLFDVAAALKIAPSLLLTDPVPEKQSEEHPSALSDQRQYLYLYDGRKKRIVKSLLVSSMESDAVTLFYDLASFNEPHHCRALYYGRRQTHEFVTNYLLDNQSNDIEHVFLCVMRSLDRPTRSAGLLSGISSRMLLPASAKCIVSSEMLPESDELRASLLLTKEDARLTKRCNMFMVEQTVL